MSDLSVLLKTMVENHASDLHIRSDSCAYVRLDGDIKAVEASEMTAKEVETLAYACMNNRARKIFEDNLEVDFSIDGGSAGRFRFNVYKQRGKVCIAIRHIPLAIPSMKELHLPEETLKKLASNERGLVLVTGITGAGKSSTLASMLDYINQLYDYHLITIEDPIEFVHTDKRSVISQREIGFDTFSFPEALRAAMRQDPDVILFGEMRDLATTHAAITAAETGHLVLGTVHTLNAVQTLSRIVDLFPPHQQSQIRCQLADTLKGIISQRLLPCLRGGRIPAVEVLIVTPHVKKLIEENNLVAITQAIQKGAYYGMQTFNQALVKLYKEGLVKVEDILATASNPDDVMLALKGIEPEMEARKGN